ncbi:MAG TPA: hypothetical protein PK247_03660 [Candidatus Goldiibacteriota bacterium]|nr:hypothetical protein [Candidatus Goldiibacteriota bacterium]
MTHIERYLIFLPLILVFIDIILSVILPRFKTSLAVFFTSAVCTAFGVLYAKGAPVVISGFTLSSFSAAAACAVILMAAVSGNKNFRPLLMFVFCALISLYTDIPALKTASFAGAGFALLFLSGISRELQAQKAFYAAGSVIFFGLNGGVFFQTIGFFFALASSNAALITCKREVLPKASGTAMAAGLLFEFITISGLAAGLNKFAAAAAVIFYIIFALYSTVTSEDGREFFFGSAVSMMFLLLYGILFTPAAQLILKAGIVYYCVFFTVYALLESDKQEFNVTALKFRADELKKPFAPAALVFITLAAEIVILTIISLNPADNQFLQAAGYLVIAAYGVCAVNDLITALGISSRLNRNMLKGIFASSGIFKFIVVSGCFIYIFFFGGVL